MENGYTLFYVEANVVCIIIFAMLLIKDLGGVGRQTKQMIFVNIIAAHIMYFVSDICWVLMLGNMIPHTRLSVSVVNIINAILLSAITGFWFVYVELSQGEKYIMVFKNRIIALIPAMCETLIMLIVFTLLPGVVINEELKMTTAYYILFLFVPIGYIIVSTVRSLIRALRKENYAVRTPYLVCAFYPVIISIAGIFQVVWITAPMFCFGCTIMMLYVYIISLNDQVSIDELTRLNNRTQLKKYVVGESSKQGSEKVKRYVLMIDLNKFKYINDQYGHVEGDHALKRAADALKSACADNTLKTFIARYGGDEFIIITKTDNEELVKELCSDIKATLIRLNDEAGADYELTASIGYASYCGDVTEFQTALAKADEALYRDKRARASA
ncbi:MAG: GGDEF domain-containing protein [Clostridiales bacterium]|nr:GGDEF domain-containing protein [Clostridiales bacterium]